jgi:cytosine/adenosine deaminase-related metal-dependent hydrolase
MSKMARVTALVLFLSFASLLFLSRIFLAGHHKQHADIIIKGATLITFNAMDEVIEDAYIVIDRGVIIEAGRRADLEGKYAAKKTIDSCGDIVMPGLINTHTHLPMAALGNIIDIYPVEEWFDYISLLEARKMNPDAVRISCMSGLLELVRSGTTTFCDMYYFEDEVARASKEVGVRAVLAETVSARPSPSSRSFQEGIVQAENYIRKWLGDDLITPAIAVAYISEESIGLIPRCHQISAE